MALPNLSYMMSVGQLRYIQARYEADEFRNPDTAVGAFLPMTQRVRCMLRGRLLISRLRSSPFYYYVVARTKYYDEVFVDAIYSGSSCIINVGCGSDTRAYRYAHLLAQKQVRVLECDQSEAIFAKQRIARSGWPTDHVDYAAIDLNDASWPDFARRLDVLRDRPVLVMLEGVSPYVNTASFEGFLQLLRAKLNPGSQLAYDYKLAGAAEEFGRSGRTHWPFRLPADRPAVEAYHRERGFRLEHMELGSALTRRMLPRAPVLFEEDCLLKLSLADK